MVFISYIFTIKLLIIVVSHVHDRLIAIPEGNDISYELLTKDRILFLYRAFYPFCILWHVCNVFYWQLEHMNGQIKLKMKLLTNSIEDSVFECSTPLTLRILYISGSARSKCCKWIIWIESTFVRHLSKRCSNNSKF